MKPTWKKYLLYASLIIVGGGVIFILVETTRAKNTGFETKNLWDWMELLIIPLFLAGGAFFLNRSERETERKAIEERAKLEREIAQDRQQEAALQAYIDRMAELLLKEKLRTTEFEEVRDVARTRTVSVMRGLNKRRNNLVIQFLREANLIMDENSILKKAHMAEMNLQDLKLQKANLQGANLWKADLQGARLQEANLQKANLSKANLQGASLWEANLQDAFSQDAIFQGVDLQAADLQDANLQGVNLQGANLQWADLQGANLRKADLQGANLWDANLQEADLHQANLQDTDVTDEQLATAKSLEGAIMPDGTKHE